MNLDDAGQGVETTGFFGFWEACDGRWRMFGTNGQIGLIGLF